MLLALAVGVLWTASLTAVFAAGVSDLRRRIIPNRLVALTAACAIALRLLADPRSLVIGIAAAVAVLLLLGALAHQNIVGGGDAKLIAAVTLLVPSGRIVGLLLWIAIGGGILSALYLTAHLWLRRSELVVAAGDVAAPAIRQKSAFRSVVADIAAHRSIPYGLAIFAGTAAYAFSEALQWSSATS